MALSFNINILAGYIFVARKSYFYTRQAEGIFSYIKERDSCLDCSALINVDAPGCGRSVVRGLTGESRKVFILGYSCTQRFPHQKCLLLVAYISHSTASSSKRPSLYKIESALHQRGPLGRTVLED